MSTNDDPTPKASANFTGEATIAPADGTGPPQRLEITGQDQTPLLVVHPGHGIPASLLR